MTTPFKASLRPDVLLRKYAHFEDPAPAPDPAPSPTPATFTAEQQAVIDKLIGGARTDGKKSALSDTLKELGFEKLDDLKTLVKSVKDQDEAKKTAEQKLIDQHAAEKKRADDNAQELADFKAGVEAEKRTTTRDNAIKTALTTANAKAEKVMALLQVQHTAEVTAVLKEDGSVDETKLKTLVEAARKAYPEDFKPAGPGTGSHTGGHSIDPGSQEKKALLQRLEQRTRNSF